MQLFEVAPTYMSAMDEVVLPLGNLVDRRNRNSFGELSFERGLFIRMDVFYESKHAQKMIQKSPNEEEKILRLLCCEDSLL